MNINNVYECTVLRITDRIKYKDDTTEYKFAVAKKTLVYQEKLDCWYWTDLITKEKYHNELSLVFAFEEDLYVPGKSLKPISAIVDFKRMNMTKSRIWKQYQNKQQQEQSGPVLVKRKTPPKNTGNK